MRRQMPHVARLPLGFALVTLVGCASLLDLQEATLDESSGGDAGQSSSAGAGSDAGGSDAGGSGGKGGFGGKGGTLSRGGTSARGGGTSAGVACGDVVEPAQGLVQACVVGNSCDPLVPVHTISFCITYDTPSSCVKGASTCGEIADCYKRTWEPDSACPANEPGWRCDGDTAVYCGGDRPWSVDCAGLGGTCLLYSSADTDSYWPCHLSLSELAACTGTAGDTSCSGSKRYTCIGGVSYGVDCAAVGLSCNAGETPGSAYCGSSSSTCASPKTSVCKNNAVQLCGSSGYSFTYSCTAGGGTCTTDGAIDWYCPAPGCSPADESSCTESCVDATTMSVCVGGAPYSINCTDYGFAECVTYTDPDGGNDYVACR